VSLLLLAQNSTAKCLLSYGLLGISQWQCDFLVNVSKSTNIFFVACKILACLDSVKLDPTGVLQQILP